MRLSVSNIGWDAAYDEPMYTFLQQQGFCGLEIAPSRIFSQQPYQQLEQAKMFANDIQQKYDLQICSMQSIWYGKTQIIAESESAQEGLFVYTKQAIAFAAAVGCNNLVFGCPKNRVVSNAKEKAIVIDFLVRIADEALRNGVVIALEANPPIYQTNFVNTTIEAIELVKSVQHPALKINLDIGTMIENNEDVKVFESYIDLINHVHVSEPFLSPLKRRFLHQEVKEVLISSGYDNYVSLEMSKQADIQILHNAILYMKEVFS